MKLKTYPVSDKRLGEFLLGCMRLTVASKRLVKEIDTMTLKKCEECGCVLTQEEAADGDYCEKCYDQLQDDRMDEQRHPDDRG